MSFLLITPSEVSYTPIKRTLADSHYKLHHICLSLFKCSYQI